MFATFLVAVVLASLAALAALLAAPRPVDGAPMQGLDLPWTGLAVVVLVAALAFVGGLMWGS